jgi:uncharacterized protein
MDAEEKFARLKKILTRMGSLVLAFSGGTDSTFLLRTALDTLGKSKVLAVIADSEIFPPQEIKEAKNLCNDLGANCLVLETKELENADFVRNTADRCYLCKREFFRKLALLSAKKGLKYVADGTNYDDFVEGRPTFQAAEEVGVSHPLADADLTKEEIRQLSRDLSLSTWNKPPRPCLASRFSLGLKITKEGISRVWEAENFLKRLGFHEPIVRYHPENMARIKLSQEDTSKVMDADVREKIVAELKGLGFSLVTVDLPEACLPAGQGSANPTRSSGEQNIDAIVEIAGRDSFAAILKFCQENKVRTLLPTYVHTATEYGDFSEIKSNVDTLRKRLRERFGVRLLDLIELENPPLWWALNGRFVSLLFQKFGFWTPCIGCHLYVHLMRVPLARKLAVKKIVSGEREYHEGGTKLNQTRAAIDAYTKILQSVGVELVQPLENLSSTESLTKILGQDWGEGDRQMSCVLSGNYRLSGKTEPASPTGGNCIDENIQQRYINDFLIPVGKKLAKNLLTDKDDFIQIVEKSL